MLASISCHIVVFRDHLAQGGCESIASVPSIGLSLDISLAVRGMKFRQRSVIMAEQASSHRPCIQIGLERSSCRRVLGNVKNRR